MVTPEIPAGQIATARVGRQVVALLLGAGAVLYSAWITQPLLHTGENSKQFYVSELAASGQPYAVWFRATDLAAAVLLGAAATIGLHVSRDDRSLRVAWSGIAVFAAATAAEVMWPLSCAPHMQESCALAELHWTVPLSHQIHSLSGGVAAVAAIISLVSFICWCRSRQNRSLAKSGATLAVVLGLAQISTLIALLADRPWRETDVGVPERIQLLATAGWLVYAASCSLLPSDGEAVAHQPPASN